MNTSHVSSRLFFDGRLEKPRPPFRAMQFLFIVSLGCNGFVEVLTLLIL
jgi:hypothetical protein